MSQRRPQGPARAASSRAVLTAIAIVLGVAMVSGTLVLTDTIDRAFDSIFASSYERHRRRRHRQGASSSARATGKRRRSRPRCSPRCGRCPASRRRPARSSTGDATGQDPRPQGQGDRHGRRADVRVRHRPEQPSASTRSSSSAGRWADGADEVVIDTSTADKQNFKVGDTVERRRRGPGAAVHDRRASRKFGDVNSLGGATFAVFTSRRRRSCSARTGQFDAISVAAKAGVSQQQLLAGDQAAPALGRAGADRRGGGEDADATASTSSSKFIRYFLLAFAGDRAVRRRVRHLQHALDHGRAADAGVRDAADDRRLAAAGAAARCWSRARHRGARLDRRARSSGC